MTRPLLATWLLAGAVAYQSFQAEIPNSHRVKGCGGRLWGGVGHQRAEGGGARNPFGEAFEAAGFKWTEELCRADSDGDGRSNGQELGDPGCTWRKGEVPQFDAGVTHPGFDCSKSVCGGRRTSEENSTAPPARGCAKYQAPGDRSHTFAFSNHGVAAGTSYVKQAFTWPETTRSAVVRFEFVIEHPQVVHHMLLYGCPKDVSRKYGAPRTGSGMGCYDVLAAWAVGASDFCTPEGIAFVIEPSSPYFLLEIHYDNPRNLEGIVDASGIRSHFVPFEGSGLTRAAVALVGTVHGLVIPPGIGNHHVQATISSRRMGMQDNGTARIFAYMQHMHEIGRQQWLTAVDETTGESEEIACNTEYDFDLQETILRDEVFVLRHGQKLVVDCVFNSTDRPALTLGGLETEDEMCLVILMFTPAVDFGLQLLRAEVAWVEERDHVCQCKEDEDASTSGAPVSSAFEQFKRMWMLLLASRCALMGLAHL